MTDLFEFEWGVDQHGYMLKDKQSPPSSLKMLLGLPDEEDTREQEQADEREGWAKTIRRCGGPLRYYRPMGQPGLWRRFADTVTTPASALAFVCEFGLLTKFEIRPAGGLGLAGKFDLSPAFLGENENTVDRVLDSARELREISRALDSGGRDRAVILFNRFRPSMAAMIDMPKPDGRRPHLNVVPSDLRSALYLQAGNAITGDLKFRRCLNCPEWFQIGSGAHTVRRKFCTTRCRVAWSRRPVEERAAPEAHLDG